MAQSLSQAAGPSDAAGLRVGRLAGIDIRIDASWLLIFALVFASLALGYFPAEYPRAPHSSHWLAGFVSALLFFASVVIHELAHSLAALRAGYGISSITLFLFGGAAQMQREPDRAAAELWIALVGPLTSFALAGAFALLAALGERALPPIAAGVFSYLAAINLALGAFNLLPGLPLDGGRALRALVWWRTKSRERGSRVAADAGQLIAFGLMGVGALQLLSGALLGGVWLVLIGLFMRNLAQLAGQEVGLREALRGARVRDVMVRDVVTVPPDLSVRDLIEDYILPHGIRTLPVVDGDRVLGVVSIDSIRALDKAEREHERVGDHLIGIAESPGLGPDAPLDRALDEMSSRGAAQLLVFSPARELVGMVTRAELLRFMQRRREFGYT